MKYYVNVNSCELNKVNNEQDLNLLIKFIQEKLWIKEEITKMIKKNDNKNIEIKIQDNLITNKNNFYYYLIDNFTDNNIIVVDVQPWHLDYIWFDIENFCK